MANKKKPPAVIDEKTAFENRLRAEKIVETINSNLPIGATKLVKIPREYVFRKSVDTAEVTAAIHSAFELCGGLPNLVKWATENPNNFFPLWAKLSNVESSNTGVQINFTSAIPSNPLDKVTIDQAGNVIEFDDDEDIPE